MAADGDAEGSGDKTGKGRQARLRAARRAQGLAEVSGWVPEGQAPSVRTMLKAIEEGRNDWLPPEVRAEIEEAKRRAAEAERDMERMGRTLDEAQRDRSEALRDRDAAVAELKAMEGGRWSGLVVRALRRWHRGRESGSGG